jgi:rare lipoprotein A
MSSINCDRTSCFGINSGHIYLAIGLRNVNQLLTVVLAAASLAACAQSSVVTKKTELLAPSRQAALENDRKTSFVTHTHAAVTKKHTPFASQKNAAEVQGSSRGLASFYTEGTQTANGEKFDPHELTAAHPTLPFGTRLRVTNLATGRSVTVRVNDRGPFVSGRALDVSYAAAEKLGMVGVGIAKVKLDIVQ